MSIAEAAESVFAAWMAEHGAIPRRLSRVYAPERADESDLHQEMLVQIWRSLPRFGGRAKPSTWIYRICVHTGLTWRRNRHRRERRFVADPVAVEQAVSQEAGPAERHEQAERGAALMAALRGLPPADRSLVVLALDGCGHREIGEIIGMTENHVGVAMLRARRRLAEAMKGAIDEV